MKLSEYIKRLQAIQRQEKRKGCDPEVCASRFSDLTTALAPGWQKDEDYPRLVEAVPKQDGEYLMRAHSTMSEEEKANVRTYVELLSGN